MHPSDLDCDAVVDLWMVVPRDGHHAASSGRTSAGSRARRASAALTMRAARASWRGSSTARAADLAIIASRAMAARSVGTAKGAALLRDARWPRRGGALALYGLPMRRQVGD